MKVAGVVVLYNAEEEVVIGNINSYIDNLGILIAVDNSDIVDVKSKLINYLKSKNAVYVNKNQNLGIAHALNIGAKMASEFGYEWLLMMDQDSRASDSLIEKLISVTTKVTDLSIGIVAPNYIDQTYPSSSNDIEQAVSVITSGSLLNLSAYGITGPFREDLFIDFVDHEYCLRLQVNNFKILINKNAILYHQPGRLSCYEFLGRRICTSNHNYIRRYYITRNRFEITNQFKSLFPEFCAKENKMHFIEMTKVVLFEKDKIRKAKSFILGYLDFKRKRFGKYRYG